MYVRDKKKAALGGRKRYLPGQLKATRLKLQHLIMEAKRYNMLELLEPGEV